MEVSELCSTSRVVIVAGKGGVGKTTTTATLAVAAARTGMRVLIVEVEGKSGLAAAFGRPALAYAESELAPGITARTLTPDAAMIEYLEGNGLGRISKRLLRSGALDVVATAVPGMKDILVLGKVKSIERDGGYDLILVDAPAAGHAITFLLSARGLLDAVRVGPVRRQAADVIELLADPARCSVILVTLPEETPVNELVETAFAIEDRVGVSLGPVVVNGCYPPLPGGLDPDDSAARVLADADAADVFVGRREAEDLAEAVRFRHSRIELQTRQAERLAGELPLPQVRLPFLFAGEVGQAGIDRLADAFADGVAAL